MESGHEPAGQPLQPPQPPQPAPLDNPAADAPSSLLPEPIPDDESRADSTTPVASAVNRPTVPPVPPNETVSGHGQHDRAPSIPSEWSAGSDRQSGHYRRSEGSNADASHRVFPIRSVVSVDESQPTPWVFSRNPTDIDYNPRQETTWDGRRRPSNPRIATDISAALRRSGTLPTSSSPKDRFPAPRRSRRNTTSDYIDSPSPDNERASASVTLTLFDDAASDTSNRTSVGEAICLTDGGGSEPGDSSSSTPAELNEAFMTTRFRHVTTDDGHAIITGRDGTPQRCEDEPIHTPGAVQAFGLLIALKEEVDGRFAVRIVSENSRQIIGYSPHELFKLGSFTEILSEEQADNLLDHIDFIRDEESDPAIDGPDVFSISLRLPRMKTIKLWCAMHVNKSHPDLIICEFEPEDDQQHPIRPPDETIPDEPEDTLYQTPTAEEFHESTEISSKPLRVLRSARNRRGEAGAMQVFDIMSQVQEQLASAPNLERFLKILVGIVKELTGFHRVMIYQFDAAFNGKVVTELVDPAKTRDLYHGLHFPASDIPKQARDLYKLNKVRLLYNRDLESARLVCRTVQDLEQPLNLSHAYLRAMSPIHLKYLANMAVRSSMSISINAFNELWGLIACHSYGPSGMRVPFPIRKMCRLVGDTASRNIERLSYASRLHARKLINTMPTGKNPSGYIVASSEDLLKLFDADFGMLCIRDETKILGKMEQSQEALAMLEYLRLRNFTSVLTTQDISQDFPDLRYKPGFSVVAGLLYVPLSLGGHDFIVFFRKGQNREVKWAGNPYDKVIKDGTANFLEPRSSFKVWHEMVIGKCREWSEEQVETAAVLCLVYGKFIEVWRQKEAALQSSRLTRLLLANSAHEVRTPLNAIINYLEIALEGTLDKETRENLAKSHSASKSLIYVINDLLDLTKTEEGQELIKDEIFDLPACISEATEAFKVDAKRKGIFYEVAEHPGLPKYVHGDCRRVRQAVSNVTANAMQNTTEGSVKVESYVVEVQDSRVHVEIAVHDTGCGMSNEKLDNLFQELEQVSSADPNASDALDASLDETHDGRTLGLGLAIVARIVRNMDGQLRLTSEEGKGSRFVIQLPFELPTGEALEKLGAGDASMSSISDSTISASVTKTLPPTEAGEVLLVDRGSANALNPSNRSITKSRSFDETNSMNSLRSGGSGSARSTKSDADRLIDAIQNSSSTDKLDVEATTLQRKISRRRHYSNTSASSTPSLEVLQQAAAHIGVPEKPSLLRRSSAGPIKSPETQSGVHFVQDSVTPIRPVKIPDDYLDSPTEPQTAQSSRVLFEIPEKRDQGKEVPKTSADSHAKPNKLQVLIAEDDPVNMKILTKRLEKAGHEVYPTLNGEDCATIYKEKSPEFDIILMDMQMPIVDGLASTKLIRAFEKSDDCPGLSALARTHGHIPIFAVSASLVEKDRAIYTEAGFDGWILKPIDFKRLHVLLEGITNDKVREQWLYKPGEWERGGWFDPRATESLQPLKRKHKTDGAS
ncbi:hsp90-like protein [Xylariaceae sp. AK1471]|nr:hsp90-like protein [Xylariaceae sp. AK1471]